MATDIQQLSGIGPSTAVALKENGLDSVEALAAATVDVLSQVKGFSAVRAQQTIDKAKAYLVDAGESQPHEVAEDKSETMASVIIEEPVAMAHVETVADASGEPANDPEPAPEKPAKSKANKGKKKAKKQTKKQTKDKKSDKKADKKSAKKKDKKSKKRGVSAKKVSKKKSTNKSKKSKKK